MDAAGVMDHAGAPLPKVEELAENGLLHHKPNQLVGKQAGRQGWGKTTYLPDSQGRAA